MPEDKGCGCAGGCCEDRYNGVSRREFIKLAGVGAAGLLATPAWGDWIARQGDAAELARWKADLFRKAPVRKYLSSTHTDARMPLGGIGTGNFELGADGQFTTWQLFNTLRDGYVPFFFAVNAGGVSRLLQTTGGPDFPHVKSIEMTGEYPLATLKVRDAELPVSLEMTSAFTPFAPLDAEFSSIPAACFVFKVHNPTGSDQKVSLGGFLQNVVGYDAIGVPISFNSVGFNAVPERHDVAHPNFGGNTNRLFRAGSGLGVAMECRPGGPATLDTPLSLFTNLDMRALNSPIIDRPEALTVYDLGALTPAAKENRKGCVIWLEDAPADLSVEVLQSAAALVSNAGAHLIFAGAAQPLLTAYAAATQGQPLAQASLQPEILFDDFENGYANWKVEGDAFGTAPARGTLANQQDVTGFLGHGLVNSYLNGDGATGKLTSKPFVVERNYIRFLVGGGRTEQTQIRLIVDGRRVRATSGKDNEGLEPALWDVREFKGKQAHIEIVDEATGGWGHINVDNIVFSDDPGSQQLYALLEQLLPARFSRYAAKAGASQLDGVTLRSGATEAALPEFGYRTLSGVDGSGAVHIVAGGVLPADNAGS